MTQVDRKYLESDNDIKVHYTGSVQSAGGSTPANNAAEGWADMSDAYQSYAQQDGVLVLEASDYTEKSWE
jgi:hypothetical protein